VVQLLPQRIVLHGKHKLNLRLVSSVSEVKKKEHRPSRLALSIAKALRLLEPRRGQQDESRVMKPVRQGESRVLKPVRQGESRVKKFDRLTCNERCSGAIKRTGISNRLSANIEHD
jgi:mannitol-1-phosphate/altronate dehydrogenase|tara:strand:- start:32 stop:379 length:348 start_codon:yes stop_codon:yes gene_type:complete